MQSTPSKRAQKRVRFGLWVFVVAALLAASTAFASPVQAQDAPDQPAEEPEPGPDGPPLPDEPTIFPTVVPDSGLVDGQTVVVTATDLPPGANVIFVQCLATASTQGDCDLSYAFVQQVGTSGTISVDFEVARQIVAADGLTDCAPDACLLGVAVLADDFFTPLETGGVPLNFDASVPLPAPPVVKASKKRNLNDGQKVRLKGSGWSTDSIDVNVEQCFTAAAPRGEGVIDSCRYLGQGFIDVAGNFNFKIKVSRSHFFGQQRLDCADDAVSCRLEVRSYARRMQSASVTVSFSDQEPLAPRPKVNLKPRRGLVDEQIIAVRLTNATLADDWNLMQCAAGASGMEEEGNACLYVPFSTDDDVAQVKVSQTLLNGREVIDCASAPNRCVIRAFNYRTQETAKKGLIFTPTNEPTMRPSVKYQTNLDELTDGAVVRAVVRGPFQEIMLSQCPAGVGNFRQCTTIAQHYAGHFDEEAEDEEAAAEEEAVEVVDASFDATSPLALPTTSIEGQARRVVWHQGEPTDCAAEAGACTLVAWSWSYGRIGSKKSLTFVDEGPPVLPTVTMKNTDLGSIEAVTATLTGMPENGYVQVQQCLSAEDYVCRYVTSSPIPESDFTLDVVVLRTLSANGEVIDCASEAELCDMRFIVENETGSQVRVGLTFDPDAPPAPAPTVSIAPRNKLKHRDIVEITVEGVYGYFGIAQCPSEATTPSQDCTYLNWSEWEMDGASGSSTAQVAVRRVLSTATQGRVDCADKGRRCKIVVLDGDQGIPISEKWISFDKSIAPPPSPTITATPSIDLADGQEIEITASSDAQYLTVLQCAGEVANEYPGRCREVAGFVSAEDTNTFTAGVARMILGNDCADVPCALVLISGETGTVEAQQPIEFDPASKKAGPFKIAVTPRTGLADRQPVEVTLVGLTNWHYLSQCVVDDGETTDSCIELANEYDPVRRTITTFTTTVRRFVNGTDCAAEPRSCAVVVNYSDGDGYGYDEQQQQKRKLLTFDPDAEPFPGPAVTVTPSTGLSNGDLVSVDGSGFRPSTGVYVGVCEAGIDVDNIFEFEGQCASEPAGFTEIDDTGSFNIEFAVLSEYEASDGSTLDCLVSGCVVLATDGYEMVIVEISFDPDAPAGEQLVMSGLDWPDSLLNGSPTPTSGFSIAPRFDLSAS